MSKRISFAIVVFVLLQCEGWSADLWCAAGNVGCLVAAINIANQNGQDNTLFLDSGVYTLRVVDNDTEGPNGLPVVTGSLTIRGPEDQGSVIERDLAAPAFRILQVAPGGRLSLDWLAIRNGRISRETEAFGGAGIRNNGTLRINRTSIYDNRVSWSAPGGGIYSNGVLTMKNANITRNGFGNSLLGGGVFAGGTVTIEDSLFLANFAGEGYGGGMYLVGGSAVTILRSTFSGNGATDGGAIIAHGLALHIEDSSFHNNHGFDENGGITGGGAITIASSTFSDNYGGAIRNSGDLSLTNVTITRNGGPAIDNIGSGVARMQNSIVAGNRLGPTDPAAVDCNRFTSLGNNIIGTLAGCAVQLRDSDRVGDPGLGTFAEDIDVMGSGHLPLLPGSPATDSASPGACPAADQLGNRRFGPCDIGAVESQDTGRVTATSLRGLIRP